MTEFRSLARMLAFAALPFLAGPTSAAPAVSAANPAPNLAVVELFQSQGCSSCPPANALLNTIADRRDVVALSFAVTYWDQLGWKDSFASPRFTNRQRDYAAAGRGEVATPELIVNGIDVVLGSDHAAFDAAVAHAGSPAGGPRIFSNGRSIRLGNARAKASATVWLVRYDPRTREVPIRAGENSGRTLPHRDIVRELVALGQWTGAPDSYALPPAQDVGLAAAILVQRGRGGPIIAASRI